jgi:membrane protein YqaA with SNARE-associated domain
MMNGSADAIARPSSSGIDRFVSSRAAQVVAFVWGFAEATFFFIVPDVLLTVLACRKLQPALKASLAALVGALIGGAVMYGLGSLDAGRARRVLDLIPAISPALISKVETQADKHGLVALLIGPLRGIPYKIYAVEWGARRERLIAFLIVSVPARYIRFFLAAVVARAVARGIEPLTRRRAWVEGVILALIWVAFYSFYFSRFGW